METSRGGGIPLSALRGMLDLERVDALLREHGGSLCSVDNHHWQIRNGERSALWLLGDGAGRHGGGLDPEAQQRLLGALRQAGLLDGQDPAALVGAPMAAAILWVGAQSSRLFWINEHSLTGLGSASLRHWLHGEITLHREPQSLHYLERIVALLERIERALLLGHRCDEAAEDTAASAMAHGLACGSAALQCCSEETSHDELDQLTRLLEQERPDLRRRVLGILSLASDRLDDALVFSMAQRYFRPTPLAGSPPAIPCLGSAGGG
ncbi:MAG: hypothetical protein ACKOZT_08800 [Cyanobium sp.]